MTNRIFETHAPTLYKYGLQAIPLYPREKKPITADWSRYAENEVEKQTQQQWAQQFPEANIGLVLGKASGVIMIDIDTDEPEVYNAIMRVLPPSPWHRKGRKGMMLAYKFSPIKTHRIKNISGQTIVECLSSRTQCVMPPSIHPDTKQPYTENVPLISVLHQLNYLPENIEELLRDTIAKAGVNLSHSGWSKVTEYVSAGSRDTTLTELAGLFAFAVVRGERTLREAIGMLMAYHSEYIENVAGDQADVGKHVANLIKFLHRDVLDKGKVLPKGWDNGYTPKELKDLGVTLGHEETEWDFDTVRKYLQEQFEQHSEGKERSDVVEKVLLKLSRSNQLTKIDEERILKYMVDVSGLSVGITTLKARLKQLRTGDVAGNDHSEIARAVIKDLEQYNLVRYHGETFMKWSGSHWVPYDRNLIQSHISTRYGHLPACKKFADIGGIMKVMASIMDQGILRREIKGINFANGFLTSELKLVPHDPDYGMVYTMEYRYMEEEAGKFPRFAQFLSSVWGHDRDYASKMAALQEVMAVTLFGLGPKFQRAVLLHGAPHTGKTQLLRIVEMLVPAEAKSSVPPNDWGDKFLPTMMHNKNLNICGELSSEKAIDGQRFKDIIDGSEMHGQLKGRQIFQFRPVVTHWFASNHIPKSKDTSAGFIRRWLFLTFTRPIRPDEVKADIGNSIAFEERESIAAWAAQGILRMENNSRYTLPESHVLMASEFSNLNNSVRFFITESNKVRLGNFEKQTNETRLYNAYWQFCAGGGGVKSVSIPVFKAMMRELSAEFNFKREIKVGAMGGSEATYPGLELLGG